ncbi:hypothetical protein [Streptococcus sp. sy010]|uniref:hypothetical protein n=1 Tax=Streptococcus sp. sy010 TaxID=2600148 RepID=UPI0011B7CB87|nr:hypothetical protein [Streptococcus sp. sy010]TWT16669.1 hypothetical protein FRX51_01800 [Streptococcus sp. sy010]
MTLETKLKSIEKQMIDLALNYANHQVDGVYIYCVTEKYVQSFDLFYRIKDTYIDRHELNHFFDTDKQIDNSSDTVFDMLTKGLEYGEDLQQLCLSYEQSYPTELWIIYDHTSKQWQTTYSYEARYETRPDHVHMTPYEEIEKWFEQAKSQRL